MFIYAKVYVEEILYLGLGINVLRNAQKDIILLDIIIYAKKHALKIQMVPIIFKLMNMKVFPLIIYINVYPHVMKQKLWTLLDKQKNILFM